MEILGIGPLELLFIVLLALIVLGPKDMVKAGKTIGRALRSIMTSDTWRVVNQASREMRNLPNRLMREAGIDDLQKQLPNQRDLSKQLGIDELNKSIKPATNLDLSSWTTSPQTIAPPALTGASSELAPEPSDDPAEALNHPAASSEQSESQPAVAADGNSEETTPAEAQS